MRMNNAARMLSMASLLVMFATPVLAQTTADTIDSTNTGRAASTAAARSFHRRMPSVQAGPQSRADSLWNGTLIGAGFGAVLGALGGDAVIDCNECAGFNVPLTFGVLGAGVGAGIGAGIDAARHQRSSIAGLSRYPRRVTVAPVVGKHLRAVVGSVRF